jgi:hypothetical protein
MFAVATFLAAVTVGLTLFFISRFLRSHDIIQTIMAEAREAASLQPTCGAINLIAIVAVFIFIMMCLLIREVHFILGIVHSEYGQDIYEIGLMAFCVLALGVVILFSIKVCYATRR